MSIIDGLFQSVFLRARSIGVIVPNVVVRETHRDDLIITDHPVERGAAISDHAFKRPAEVEMLCGWSDSSGLFPGYVRLVYQQLLGLQIQREPFSVSTGKRRYSNMLVASLSVTTDEHSENILMVTARLREIIIVSTQTTQAPASAQSNPASTQGITSRGTVQALPSAAASSSLGFGFATPAQRS